MSEFFTWVELGFRHITDPNGADHILFLLALAAIYGRHDARRIVWVVSAFTVGHSVTLALAVTGLLRLPTPLIEFLIPVTIVLTAIGNLDPRVRGAASSRHRPALAGVFGLVHGAGFANYLQSLFVDQVALPLFGFNVGIELGQLVVLGLAFTVFLLLDGGLARWGTGGTRGAILERGVPPFRTRLVSASVALIAARWAVERAPW